MTEEKLFECPRCGNFAEFISDYNSARVECKKCGPTKILLSFNSNGDMQTVSENDGKEYAAFDEIELCWSWSNI